MTAAIIARTRSFLSGQSVEAFGLGRRYPLTKQVKEKVKQISEFANVDLSGYTFERRHSEYRSAKSDIIVYDGSGEAVIYGREFSGGPAAFWTPSQSRTKPELWSHANQTWGSA